MATKRPITAQRAPAEPVVATVEEEPTPGRPTREQAAADTTDAGRPAVVDAARGDRTTAVADLRTQAGDLTDGVGGSGPTASEILHDNRPDDLTKADLGIVEVTTQAGSITRDGREAAQDTRFGSKDSLLGDGTVRGSAGSTYQLDPNGELKASPGQKALAEEYGDGALGRVAGGISSVGSGEAKKQLDIIDGEIATTRTSKDGVVTKETTVGGSTIVTNRENNTVTVERPDGSITTTKTNADGSTTTTDKNDEVTGTTPAPPPPEADPAPAATPATAGQPREENVPLPADIEQFLQGQTAQLAKHVGDSSTSEVNLGDQFGTGALGESTLEVASAKDRLLGGDSGQRGGVEGATGGGSNFTSNPGNIDPGAENDTTVQTSGPEEDDLLNSPPPPIEPIDDASDDDSAATALPLVLSPVLVNSGAPIVGLSSLADDDDD